MDNEQKIIHLAEDIDRLAGEVKQLSEDMNKLNSNVEKLLAVAQSSKNDTDKRLADILLKYIDKKYLGGEGDNENK